MSIKELKDAISLALKMEDNCETRNVGGVWKMEKKKKKERDSSWSLQKGMKSHQLWFYSLGRLCQTVQLQNCLR